MSEAGLRLISEALVAAAKTLPQDKAEDVVYTSLAKFEREVTLAAGREAKAIVDGLRALSETMSHIARTKAPLIPVLQALVALEDEARACDPYPGPLRDAIAKVTAARELPRGHATETG